MKKKLGYGALWLLTVLVSVATATLINGYVDFFQVAAPANPATGNARLFVSSSTHVLSCLLPSGSSCIGGGGGGGVTISGNSMLTDGMGSFWGPIAQMFPADLGTFNWL